MFDSARTKTILEISCLTEFQIFKNWIWFGKTMKPTVEANSSDLKWYTTNIKVCVETFMSCLINLQFMIHEISQKVNDDKFYFSIN